MFPLALNRPEWGRRLKSNSLDFASLSKLTFEPVDKKRFPCFDLIVNSAKKGGSFPAVANGANDTAVDLFLKGKIGYCDIYSALFGALDAFKGGKLDGFNSLENANAFAVRFVKEKFGV